jgi:hypothetical protein|tara:strand:- start:378 stop:500 length:123 start_codon:yes stop_codon:yes gene_type:complete
VKVVQRVQNYVVTASLTVLRKVLTVEVLTAMLALLAQTEK